MRYLILFFIISGAYSSEVAPRFKKWDCITSQPDTEKLFINKINKPQKAYYYSVTDFSLDKRDVPDWDLEVFSADRVYEKVDCVWVSDPCICEKWESSCKEGEDLCLVD